VARILLFFLLILSGLCLFATPWFSALAYVANSLLQPQYIWHWVFDGIPVFKITAALAILSFLITFAKRKSEFSIYKCPQNFLLMGIWVWMHLSDIFSPFTNAAASVSPAIVLDTIDAILIMYFVLLPVLNAEKPLKYFCSIFVLVGVYYVYWANSAYFTESWHLFSNNRLKGPASSPYADGNVLSVLILMTLPFLILEFGRRGGWAIRLVLALFVVFSWHSLILFGSRAALLSSIVMLLLIALVVRSKKMNIILGISFAVFVSYQGALMLQRATDTVEQAQVGNDEPINPRLISWSVGLKLIPEYPLFGAGVQKFEAASRVHFPGKTQHVAHNTFLNFSVNSGLIAGVCYLLLIYTILKRFLAIRSHGYDQTSFLSYALLSSTISLLVFFVSSVFLDLIIFEPFYMMLIINLIAWEFWIKRDGCNTSETAVNL
jgi:O-antigen ligase|tara:strand:+ start:6547 stop:7848 length:1302 start_codon:yes stop_codon:yes gene_type:complete